MIGLVPLRLQSWLYHFVPRAIKVTQLRRRMRFWYMRTLFKHTQPKHEHWVFQTSNVGVLVSCSRIGTVCLDVECTVPPNGSILGTPTVRCPSFRYHLLHRIDHFFVVFLVNVRRCIVVVVVCIDWKLGLLLQHASTARFHVVCRRRPIGLPKLSSAHWTRVGRALPTPLPRAVGVAPMHALCFFGCLAHRRGVPITCDFPRTHDAIFSEQLRIHANHCIGLVKRRRRHGSFPSPHSCSYIHAQTHTRL